MTGPTYDRPEPQDSAEWALWAHAANPDRTTTRAGRVGAVRQAVATAVRGCILRMPALTEAEIAEAVAAEMEARKTPEQIAAEVATDRAWEDALGLTVMCRNCATGRFTGSIRRPCEECDHARELPRPEWYR